MPLLTVRDEAASPGTTRLGNTHAWKAGSLIVAAFVLLAGCSKRTPIADLLRSSPFPQDDANGRFVDQLMVQLARASRALVVMTFESGPNARMWVRDPFGTVRAVPILGPSSIEAISVSDQRVTVLRWPYPNYPDWPGSGLKERELEFAARELAGICRIIDTAVRIPGERVRIEGEDLPTLVLCFYAKNQGKWMVCIGDADDFWGNVVDTLFGEHDNLTLDRILKAGPNMREDNDVMYDLGVVLGLVDVLQDICFPER